MPKPPRIPTTTVGSDPVPERLAALPGKQAILDATIVILHMMKTWLPILMLAVLVSGCEIWDPRPGIQDIIWKVTDPHEDPTSEIRKKEFRTWPKSIREAVDARLVLVGMTKNQVLVSLRIAEKNIQKNAVTTATDEPIETWTGWRLLTSWSYVKRSQGQMVTLMFRNGVVTRIYSVAQP